VPLHCPALHPPPPPLADIYIPIDLGRWAVEGHISGRMPEEEEEEEDTYDSC